MIDLTQAVDASARRILGERYETFDKVALSNLKQELLNVIVPAYAAIQESLKAEVLIQVGKAFDHGAEMAWAFDADLDEERGKMQDRALSALEIG